MVDVSQLGSWNIETLTKLPLFCHLNNDALQTIVEMQGTVSPYPVHTQVELVVMTVTELCSRAYGEEACHKYLCAALNHWHLPVFNCKHDL